MHICEVNGSGYGATEKINFWRVMTFLKVAAILNRKYKFFLMLAVVYYYFLSLSRLNSIGCNYSSL